MRDNRRAGWISPSDTQLRVSFSWLAQSLQEGRGPPDLLDQNREYEDSMTGSTVAGLIQNGQLLVAALVAVLAGLVSFASPCILPLVPGYIGYVGGMSGTAGTSSRSRTVLGVGMFVLGFTVVFDCERGLGGCN